MLVLVPLLLLLPLSSTRQPNIIYILADDLGHADLGFKGTDHLSDQKHLTWDKKDYLAATTWNMFLLHF